MNFVSARYTLIDPLTNMSKHVNGDASAHPKWSPGPGAPLTTPFNDDQSVNHSALAKQVIRVAQTGTGIVLLGTTGEGEDQWRPGLTCSQQSVGRGESGMR